MCWDVFKIDLLFFKKGDHSRDHSFSWWRSLMISHDAGSCWFHVPSLTLAVFLVLSQLCNSRIIWLSSWLWTVVPQVNYSIYICIFLYIYIYTYHIYIYTYHIYIHIIYIYTYHIYIYIHIIYICTYHTKWILPSVHVYIYIYIIWVITIVTHQLVSALILQILLSWTPCPAVPTRTWIAASTRSKTRDWWLDSSLGEHSYNNLGL